MMMVNIVYMCYNAKYQEGKIFREGNLCIRNN